MFLPEDAELSKIFIQVRKKKPADGSKWTVPVPVKPKDEVLSIPPQGIKNLTLDASIVGTCEISTEIDGNDWAEARIQSPSISLYNGWQVSLKNGVYQTICSEMAMTAGMSDRVNVAVMFAYNSIKVGDATIAGDSQFIGSYALLAGCEAVNMCDADFSLNYEAMAFDFGWDAQDNKVKFLTPEGTGREAKHNAAFMKAWNKTFSG